LNKKTNETSEASSQKNCANTIITLLRAE
jgi:hypothetical protein